MKVLELFAGTRSIGKAFESRGHEVFSVEWNKDFEDIDLYEDINSITAEDILQKFGRPDVIWASPDCSTFSVAAISKHRRKNKETGSLDPITDYAKFCDEVDQHVLQLIEELQPKFWFIENPRGGMRKMEWMQGLPRHTVTYCQYELDKPVNERRMKPTDIWTNHSDPQFKPPCKNGDTCHAAAPRGSQTGTQAMKNSKEKGVIPEALCQHIVDICEKYILKEDKKKMKVYIAGAISSNPNYIEQFAAAEKKLLAEGHAVINPVKNLGFEYKDYIDMGLCELMKCDAIYLLNGWHVSDGANLEYHYALVTGMTIISEDNRKGDSE